jgi:hypothetical protein
MPAVEFVALILFAVALAQAAIWVPLLLWIRSRSNRWEADFRHDLGMSGETIVRGPERAMYQGATSGYSRVGGNGVIVLTHRRLLFRKVTGGIIEVPVDQITGLSEAKTFLRRWRGGRPFLIVKLASGAELGFLVGDHAAWRAALDERVHAGS